MELTEDQIEWRTVKAVFRSYRHNLQLLKRLERADRVQSDYQLSIAFTDSSINLVADYVVARQEAQRYNDLVVSCVKRLTKDEQKIIRLSYMAEQRVESWKIYEQEVHVGRTLYFTTKSKAIGKLFLLFTMKGIVKENQAV